MIRARHWFIAGLTAVSLQIVAFMYSSQFQQDGAKNKGEQGIEIDLGMLGELGESAETAEPESQLTEMKEPVVDEVVTEPELVEAPVEISPVKPVAEAKTIQEKQQSEVKVKKKTVEQPVPVNTSAHAEPSVETKSEPVKAVRAITRPQPNQSAAQQKQTTGKANSLSTGGKPAVNQSYFSALAAKLAKHKRYPAASRRRGEEGIVKLHFVVDRSGKVLEFHISESSGSKQLDDAVIKMLKKAQPLPSFPAEMTMPQLEVNVPIAFQLNSS